MLTEESGFAGGMMWTGNNIDATHLKSIVNFDYDDTTSYLKTRDPFVSEQAHYTEDNITFTDVLLDHNKGTDLLGVYNICAHLATDDSELTPAGWLYWFARVNTVNGLQRCDDQTFQLFFKDDSGNWFPVEYNPTYTLISEDADEHVVQLEDTLVSAVKLHPTLYDNVLYCTSSSPDRVCSAYRLILRFNSSNEGEYDNLTARRYVLEPQLSTPYMLGKESPAVAVTNIRPAYLVDEDTGDMPAYNWTFSSELVDSTTLLEAASTGFNGARGADTFVYKSTSKGSKAISGVYLTDEDNNITVSPRLGQNVTMNVVLEGVPTTSAGVISIFELLQNGDSSDASAWKHVGYIEAVSVEKAQYVYSFSNDTTTFAFVWLPAKVAEGKETVTDTDAYTSLMPVTWVSNQTSVTSRLKAYPLPSARASCLWNGRLVVWDLDNNSNVAFISEVDNFYYFPVPQNVAVFETNIISCIPYLGDLLVFTADRIYKLSVGSDGSFVQEVVQNDMPVTKEDAPYLRAIKNMVFFKSGKYFYMVVPKSQSLTGELTIAPIYKNIAGYLNDVEGCTTEVLSALYPEHHYDTCTLSSAPVDIYSEQDTVHVLYNVTTTFSKSVDGVLQRNLTQTFVLFLNYNTNLRAWTLYLEDTTDYTLHPAALTPARSMDFVRVGVNDYTLHTAQMQHSTQLSDAFRCLIDTGYRTLTNAIKKRFREIQVKLYSETENITEFGSAFYLDGCARKSYTRLEEAFVDESSHSVTLTPVFDPNTLLLEDIMPLTPDGQLVSSVHDKGSDAIELANWALDFSHFKRGSTTTLRIPVSGKGYAPRFILMAPKCTALYINEVNWVYRMMYGR